MVDNECEKWHNKTDVDKTEDSLTRGRKTTSLWLSGKQKYPDWMFKFLSNLVCSVWCLSPGWPNVYLLVGVSCVVVLSLHRRFMFNLCDKNCLLLQPWSLHAFFTSTDTSLCCSSDCCDLYHKSCLQVRKTQGMTRENFFSDNLSNSSLGMNWIL